MRRSTIKRIGIIILFYAIFFQNQSFAQFNTLSEINRYALSQPENPPPQNNDLLNPDFTWFYQAHAPNAFTRLMNNIFPRYSRWTLDGCIQLMNRLTERREKAGYIGRFVIGYMPTEKDKFIIFGGIYGALHSLVRCLNELKSQGILNEDLTVNPEYTIIFVGNVVDLSPYLLESLHIVMQLLYKNLQQVFYIRGWLEDGLWKTQGLSRELMMRGRAKKFEIPYEQEVQRFFNTLPLGIFLQGRLEDGSMGVLRVSYYDLTSQELQNNKILPLLTTWYERPEVIHIDRVKPIQAQLNNKSRLVAIIRGLRREYTYEPTQGLLRLQSKDKVQDWNILSAPNLTFKRLQNFFNDAFVLLTCAPYINDWKLQLYRQDALLRSVFEKDPPLYVMSGYKKGTHESIMQAKPIQFGSSVDLTKSIRIEGQGVKRVIETLFDNAREKQLIPGFAPYVDVLDDEYDPVHARKNSLQFLNVLHINKLLLPMGSPTVGASLDLVKEKKLLILFPLAGATLFRNPDLKYLINMRSDYSHEGYLLTKYILDRYSPTRFALFYQDDAFGQSCLIGARYALQEAGIKNVIELPYQRNDVNFPQQVKQIKNFFPTAIGLFSTTTASEGLVRDMGLDSIMGKILYGNSFLGESKFKAFLRAKGLRVAVIHATPSPAKSKLPIAQEFREFAKNSAQPIALEAISFEAYIAITYLLKILKKIAPHITTESIVKAIEDTKNLDHGGILFNFDPRTRELMSSMWIDDGYDKDWVEVKIPREIEIPPFVYGSKYQWKKPEEKK